MGYNTIKALGYRVICSFGKRKITMVTFIIIPICLAVILVVLNSNSPRKQIEPLLSPTLSLSTFLRIANSIPLTLVVSPNSPDVKKVMEAAKARLNVELLTYMERTHVSQYVSDLYSKSHGSESLKKTIFGVDFEILTNERLTYNIRSTESYWHTGERFPKEWRSGPMDNGDAYSRGFLALQMVINDEYINTHLKRKLEDFLLQPFPHPKYKESGDNVNHSIAKIILWLSIVFIATVLGTLIIQEKASGVREMLKINGVETWMIYSTWFAPFGLLTFVIALIIATLWTVPVSEEAVFPGTNTVLLFFIILIFFWSTLCSVSFIASFISSPKYGVLIVIAYLFLTSIISSAVLDYLFRDYGILIILAFLPFGGLCECFEAIAAYETSETGLTFSNLFNVPLVPSKILPAGSTLLIMMTSMVVYLAAMLYIDAIKPGQYGRAKPWSFILPMARNRDHSGNHRLNKVQPKEKNTEIENTSDVTTDNEGMPPTQNSEDQSPLVEPVGRNVVIGIRAKQLEKRFGKFKAVDNLSMTMWKNEITVLLGHNGAGKTTLFFMICGMYSPTSGDVLTENYSVFEGKNLGMFRRELGYCPQHNLLLDDLTIRQHLIFFGLLKGLDYVDAKSNSNQLTNVFNIYDSRNEVPHKLSGGMKRKLCLSIAMVGKPKFLLLDEPTSGLDPESRREVWNVLLGTRNITTTVITTHYMEEADVLADRIAIIVHGKLKCCGTTMFLKQYYGVGYTLNCSSQDKDANNLLSTVRGYISSAQLVSKTDKTLSISLPASEVKKFPALLLAISKQTDATLSCSTMDDVFLRVQQDEGIETTVINMPMDEEMRESHQRVILQLKGLFVKRFKWWYLNWIVYSLMLILLPVVVTFFTVHQSNNAVFIKTGNVENLSLTLDTFNGGRGIVAKNLSNATLGDLIESSMRNNGLSYVNLHGSEVMLQELLSIASKDLMDYRMNEIVAFDTRTIPTALFSTLAYHSLPIAYGVLINAMINEKMKSTITTYNFPYKFEKTNICKGGSGAIEIVALWSVLFAVPILIATSYYIFFPHIERVTGFKHLQLMTGVWPLFYWLPILIIDLIILILPIILVIVVIFLSDSHNLFVSMTFLQFLTLGLVMFGISSILLAYLWSFFFKTYSNAILAHIAVSIILTIASFLLTLTWSHWKVEYIYFLPWAILIDYLNKIVTWSIFASTCKICHEDIESGKCNETILNSSLETYRLDRDLMFFAIDALLFLFLILSFDHGLWSLMKTCMERILYGKIKFGYDMDTDVANEKERIKNIDKGIQDGNTEPPVFVCDSLGKKYSRKVIAVYDVTFGVQRGECFGILGVNGAGKSTTFGMLTALIIPTKGNAKVMEYKLNWHRKYKYLKRLGYCPQLGGLLLELSARSLITLFGLLRGIPSSQVKILTQKWINALDMGEICDKPCKHYSEGNKRKVSTAIAMIGSPPVVLLDEPTTGVDPVIRRKIWSILRYCLENNKQTILLTSHSMDECEAVCGRITIMVKGVMRCINSIPSLKKKYGKGCILQVKLAVSLSDEEVNIIQTTIESKFAPHIQSKETQHSLLTFYISSEKMKINEMFDVIIGISNSNKNIEDFNLSDVSLEHVFLSFANVEQE